jgi:hypothetical protein
VTLTGPGQVTQELKREDGFDPFRKSHADQKLSDENSPFYTTLVESDREGEGASSVNLWRSRRDER